VYGFILSPILKVEVASNWWLSAQEVRVTEIVDINHHSFGIGMQIWVYFFVDDSSNWSTTLLQWNIFSNMLQLVANS